MEIISAHKKYMVEFYMDFKFMNNLKSIENAFFVIDEKIADLYKKTVILGIPTEKSYIITAIEENKTIEQALNICEKIMRFPSKRNTVLISIGGGIVQDITGFVANILYRGIKWIFVPTTLLSACDSCIGGKTSLNYKYYKNILGTFYPPNRIYICPIFFGTLSDRDFKSGLGEVVKFNILYGVKGIQCIEDDMDRLLERDMNQIIKYVKSSLELKKIFIEKDEFDYGERIKLNFAHTFGHAIESATDYKIPHGTAVAMGTVIANYISQERGWLSKTINGKINSLIKKIVSTEYNKIDINIDSIMHAIRNDKKQIDNGIRAVLLKDDTTLYIINDLTQQEVINGFKFMIDFLMHE